MDLIGFLQDKIKGSSFAVWSHRVKSSHTTLWLKNIIKAISRRDQPHSAAGWLRFGSGRMMWPSCHVSGGTLMSLHLFAVAAANLLLPDVIKGGRSSEWQRKRRRRRRWWRSSPFFSLSSSSVGGTGDTHSGFNTVQTQAEWANAWCRDSHQGALSRRIKKAFLSPSFGLALEDTPWIWEKTLALPHAADPYRGPA